MTQASGGIELHGLGYGAEVLVSIALAEARALSSMALAKVVC